MVNTEDKSHFIDYDDIEQETDNDELLTSKIHHNTDSVNIRTLITNWNDGELLIPKFQRRFVWTLEQASSFIESLMLDLPISSIMIYKDVQQFQYIIDGQQRIKSILYFIGELGEDSVHNEDKKFVRFKLKGLSKTSRYYEKTYNDANSFSSVEQRKLKNLSIFKRLNTCGTPLTAQEIRYCVYSGSFNNFIYNLNKNEIWQSFFTNKTDI